MNQLTLRKRYLVATAVLGLFGTMLGCTAEDIDEDVSVDYGEDTLTEADNAAEVMLAADRVLALKLPARFSAGYGWTIDAIDDSVLKVADDDSETQALGGPNTQVLRFVGVKPGTTVLTLKYGRRWEKAPQETYSVKINVAGAYTGNFQRPRVAASSTVEMGEPVVGLPARYSSCEQGACTPVKDQGGCGSCWAFATAGVVETAIALKDKVSRDLSEQFLMSCNTFQPRAGCDGGTDAFQFFTEQLPGENAAGVVYESDFPYEARDRSCDGPYPHHEKLKGSRHPDLTVNAMKQAILETGSVVSFFTVEGPFFSLGSEIYRGSPSPGPVNHALVLVGWDDNNGDGYWIARNSWGTGWGDHGYGKIKYGANRIQDYVVQVMYDGSGNDNPDTCPVKLFADPNYTGASTCLDVGRFDIDKLRSTIGNDKLSSVRVKSGYKATLFQHSRFQGTKKVLTGDAPSLPSFNDTTSSVIVERP